ncbi:RagB/SusD family nutrient uptake outer membrane protein [Salegentibacter maritimus]|uniref:RagB/SusD family nutrient uptake outer membrane protein n=1 Tax=Salegentibacter maritimus TaxID=2794347 RepID=UPI0018E4C55D|nr:RagB/SusD family nutrient uptake outer membrane protein [Salegentibacter maritimus]MBI6117858.1 RagB/SusD family nutrient uptake outer membrane protein [Salegentibacter maritimus]
MKRILILLLIASISVFYACNDDFMDRKPLDSISDDNFWNKPDDLRSFANRFYSILINPGSIRNFDNQSDVKVPRNPDNYLYGDYIVPTTGGGWSTGNWSNIRAANYFLTRYSEVVGDESMINSYVGEVRFFRALEYFNKVKRFGDVPWLNMDLNIDDTEILYGKRDSRKVVIDSILADLDFAIENLDEKDRVDNGRLHKAAAQALKARISLYEGTFRKYHGLGDYEELLKKAKNTSLQIIQSNNYSIYKNGQPGIDYYNLFIQENLENNPEVILSRSFISDIQTHNVTRQMEESYTGFSKKMVESYLVKDGLPIALSDLYLGDNTLSMEVENRDPRLWQTIDSKKLPFKIDEAGNPVYNELPIVDPNYCTTGYCVIKFHSPYEEQWNANQSDLDLIIFRYAEVLLIYAEAVAELGEIEQNDLDISINKLRERVAMPFLNVSVGFNDPNWPDYGYEINPLLHEIRRERRVELAAEGFRWDDLVRWKAGELVENPKTVYGMKISPEMAEKYGSRLENIQLTEEGYIDVYPDRGAPEWVDKMYLYPIPIQELTLNPDLEQNPGW